MFHIVIADRKQVRVLEESGPEGQLYELAVLHNPDTSAHERDLLADRPGRIASSANGGRQTYTLRASARELALERWLKLAGRQIQGLLSARRSDGCVLVASPRLLSSLGAALPASAAKLPRIELPRDLAKLPDESLHRRLRPALRELRRARARNAAGRSARSPASLAAH